jgi:DtxR family Mn-dependent transcriptional regulator
MPARHPISRRRPGLPEGDLRTRVRGSARDDLGPRAADGCERAVDDRDDERLAELGLVERLPYRGVALTGRAPGAARSRCYATTVCSSVTSSTASGSRSTRCTPKPSCLEHALSEELGGEIDAELGFPTHDPHGDPIPGSQPSRRPRRRSDTCSTSSRAHAPRSHACRTVTRRCSATWASSGSFRARISSSSTTRPFGGPVTVRTERGEHAISRELADRIAAA